MKKLVSILALVPLAACIRFGAEPPPALLTLTAAAEVPVGVVQNAASQRTISIAVPTAPRELAVTRVPVRSSDISVAYVKDAQWVEEPARLFARLLSDTVTARAGRVVIGDRERLTRPGDQLSGELRTFGVDAATSEAVVVFDANLVRLGRDAIERRRFEARVPVAAIEAPQVGTALNQAANQVATEVATWIAS